MKAEPLRLVDVPREQHEFARCRIAFLLSPRGLAIAKHDLLDLLAMAYAQGLSDTLEALEGRGVDLSAIESWSGASMLRPRGEMVEEGSSR